MNIKERHEKLKEEMSNAQYVLDCLKGNLIALQLLCKHPNAKPFKSSDYSGDTYTVINCPDCGYYKEN